MAIFPGITRLGVTGYSDVRVAGQERENEKDMQPEALWYHNHYPEWRSAFNGSIFDETVSATGEIGSTDAAYKWPVRFNLVYSYCLLHSGMLWGRGRSGADAGNLFTVHVDPVVPGLGKPRVSAAPELEDRLQYFWANQAQVLRPNGIIQQWAGGSIIKATWNPHSPAAVYGVVLETIQPEHFFPIWDSLNYEVLLAAKIRFSVSKSVAIAKYGVKPKEIESYKDSDQVPVEEYWDRNQYYIVLGKEPGSDRGIPARNPVTGEPLRGQNPWINPLTKTGVVPIVYVPRIRVGGFFGDSLAYQLLGLQAEVNKTLADVGDALTRGAHPAFGISDYTGPQAQEDVIEIPSSGAINLGRTRQGGEPPKVHTFPAPNVPNQITIFTDQLLSLSEVQAGLTPAARGQSKSADASSGISLALQMLPTTNLVDWERSHWGWAIGGRAGLDEIVQTIWYNTSVSGYSPRVEESVFACNHKVEFLPVIPRDRVEVIDEVVRLATARAVSPQNWLERLGDIEDVDEELVNLVKFISWMAQIEAAVAGRNIKINERTSKESAKEPSGALPQVSGQTDQPATRQPATQPQGQKAGSNG